MHIKGLARGAGLGGGKIEGFHAVRERRWTGASWTRAGEACAADGRRGASLDRGLLSAVLSGAALLDWG